MSSAAAPATSSSGLIDALQRLQPLGLAGQQRRRVQHERQLHDLAGLELQRAGAEPAARAVDLHADARDLHRHEQPEGDDEHDRPEALRQLEAAPRHDLHEDQSERPVHEVLHEVGRAVPRALEQRPRRGRAVDHHRAAGHEAQRRRQEDLVLERICVGSSTPGPLHAPELRRARTSSLNARPRASKSANWSKDAHAGDRSTTSPCARPRGGPRDGRLQVAAAARRRRPRRCARRPRR